MVMDSQTDKKSDHFYKCLATHSQFFFGPNSARFNVCELTSLRTARFKRVCVWARLCSVRFHRLEIFGQNFTISCSISRIFSRFVVWTIIPSSTQVSSNSFPKKKSLHFCEFPFSFLRFFRICEILGRLNEN